MKRWLLTFGVLLCTITAQAQATFQTRVVKENLFILWEILWGPDDHIWLTQKNGFICRLDPETGAMDTLWHQTNTHIKSEGGMLGLAVHPQLLSGQPYVYVAYEYLSGSTYLERIQRLTYNAGSNTLGSPLTLLDSIPGASFHNGCRLLIADNYLWITTGDATVAERAQDVASLNGKLLRMNLDGTVPADNPIAGSYVYSWGHRNAQGLVYANNRIYSSEHGPATDDEINLIQKGRNYGWPNVAGFCDQPSEMTFCTDSNVVAPLYAWTPTIATSGIDYYDHPMFPGWQQSILMTTLKDSRLYRLKLGSDLESIDSVLTVPGVSFGRLRDVCVSPDGRVFVSTSNSSASGTGAYVDKIIELADTTALGISEIPVPGIRLTPNPARDQIMLTFDEGLQHSASYAITDVQGRVVLRGRLAGGTMQTAIRVQSLPAGSYWLRLSGGGKSKGVLRFEKK